MKTLFIHNQSLDTSIECDAKYAPLWWQTQCLQFTASGYGRKIPTSQMVRYMGKWRRVYCCIYSNVGTCYIGKLSKHGNNFILSGCK